MVAKSEGGKKKLESEGVGRPSTYAPTISTIQDRQYAERGEDKRLRPTDLGEVVTDYLVNHFTDIVNLNFTARIEEDLDERKFFELLNELFQKSSNKYDSFSPDNIYFIANVEDKSKILIILI